MPSYDWESFLRQWNNDLLNAPNLDDFALPDDVVKSGWLGFPGASEAQIAAAEVRLGIERFPPSYREFLFFTNGWRTTGTFIDRIWSAEEVEWFRVRNGDLIEIYSSVPYPDLPDERYFDYDDEEAATYIRTEHLKTLLEISDVGDDARYLLNPKVKDASGEWEAWFDASWLPGFCRYPSFWALMQAEYESFKMLDAQEKLRYRPEKESGTLREKLPGLVQELERLANEIAHATQGGMAAMSGVDSAYHEGFSDGLRDASQRVQQLANETSDDSALLDGLHRLAQTLSREAQNLQPRMNSAQILLSAALPRRTAKIMSDAGMQIGKQKASGTIEWFLNP